MADRYQERPFPSDDYGRGSDPHGKAESDPLAELARLIGQTDPFGTQGRPAAQPQAAPYQPPAQDHPAESYAPESYPEEDYQESYEEPPQPPPGPPAWMRRANVQAQPAPLPQQDYAPPVHPLQRYATQEAAPEPDHYQPQAYSEYEAEPDPSRYDDALYGQLESREQDFQREPAYPDDPYAYQSDYPEDELDDAEPRKQRGGMMTVAAILALAVVGTAGAYGYKTYLGSPRSGEPPVIKADNSPTKIVPAPTDGSAKLPDRMAAGDGTEKIVPREEAPVDVNSKAAGPRVVFPALNQNANPPPVASVSPSTVPPPSAGPAPNNGTMPNSEPRKVKTLSVKGDQGDGAPQAVPSPAAAAKPPAAAPKAAAPATPRNPPTSANASANQPLSLSPQAGPQDTPAPSQRMASTTPTQIAPASSGGGGGYLVQVSSQRSESDAQASYRALQGKFPGVFGSRSPVIKRADLGDKGVYYRAMVGPFGSPDEAAQFCGSLKNAGGQCVVQRN
jgi:hypothetical protein